MESQSKNLLNEWYATAINRLNPSHALKNAVQLQETFNGEIYSRVHRLTNGNLILEERKVGSMYPKVWSIVQDFSELDNLLNNKLNNK